MATAVSVRPDRRRTLPEPPGWLDIDRRALLDALAAVKPAVAARPHVAALAGVRVVSDDDGARVWATELTVSACRALAWLDGSAEAFDALVPHAVLVRALKLFPADEVRLTAMLDGSRTGLRITAGAREVVVEGLPTEEHPVRVPFHDVDPGPARIARLDGRELAGALDAVLPSASRDETRPVLGGVVLQTGRVFATDSYQLVVAPLPGLALPTTLEAQRQAAVNVPAAALAAVRRRIERSPEVTVRADRRHVRIALGGDGEEEWTIATIDGQVPNPDQLLPDRGDLTVTLNRAQLASAAAAAAALAPGEPVRLAFGAKRSRVTVSAGGRVSATELTETLRCSERWHGTRSELVVAVNPGFLARIAGEQLDGPEVVLDVISPLRRPIALRDDTGVVALLMPIRDN